MGRKLKKSILLISIVSVLACVGMGCVKKENQNATIKPHINDKQFFKVKPQDTTPKGKGFGSWQ
jgi:hypothetical protein